MTDATPSFLYDDRPVEFRTGDSIAAALAQAGIDRLGERMSGVPRGVYCGMGACQDCLVIVEGERSVRACMRTVAQGMSVRSQVDRDGPVAQSPLDAEPPESRKADCVIVGAGPAGLEAAIAASAFGLSVLVLDERSAAGGQYFKPPSSGSRKDVRDAQHRAGDALREHFDQTSATIEREATVWFTRAEGDGFTLRYTKFGREQIVSACAVILATGAHEKPAPVPGWCSPGVMTIGAAQTYARRYGVAPGKKILIAGQGPLGLQLAAELLDMGVDVVGVAERSKMKLAGLTRMTFANPRLAATGAGYLAGLWRQRVPLWPGSEVIHIGDPDPQDSMRDVTLAALETGETRTVRADAVCMGDGFLPQLELARLLGCGIEMDGSGLPIVTRADDGATDVAGVWIAGDGGGLGGAQVALAQGRLAGLAAARHCERDAAADPRTQRRLRKARRFQSALWTAFDAPPRKPPADSTIVCRCESVTAGAIREALDKQATDSGAIKRSTRCGMGRCQGRFCTSTLVGLLAERGIDAPASSLVAPQLPARPTRIGLVTRERPEWGGHREAKPSARPDPARADPLPLRAVDVLVIGAGVTGLSAALRAAESGSRVLCVDRGRAGAEASGGNAGSLHLQLLSWDFGKKAVAGGSPALRTLPLQAESIGFWSDLETQSGADFEMKITGGLMLAENRDQIDFLKAKARAEGEVGIETHVIETEEIQKIAPALSDRFFAAAWCPGEGKINPLAANEALLCAARAAGVLVEERCPVLGIVQDGNGYEVETSGGSVRADRIVIATGGWSAQLGRFLNVELPIRGAPLQMIVTEPAPPLVPCLVAHADRHLTLKQAGVGSLLIGGAWPAAVNAKGQSEVLPESLEGNLWVAARTVPAVSSLHMVRSWAAMNIDIDGAPLISHLPGHPRIVVAATANGYTLGPLVGRAAADGVMTGTMRADLQAFTLARFET